MSEASARYHETVGPLIEEQRQKTERAERELKEIERSVRSRTRPPPPAGKPNGNGVSSASGKGE
jgi:hypothetical protein